MNFSKKFPTKSSLAHSGLFLIDKPKGVSSFAVVRQIQHFFKKQGTPIKLGHTGTLDPFATGLMIICSNEATRFAQYFLGKNKTYHATIQFGIQTSTGDPEGSIINTEKLVSQQLTRLQIENALSSFLNQIYLQTPPMHSAKQVNGKRLYTLARQGIEVERKAVECKVINTQVLSYSKTSNLMNENSTTPEVVVEFTVSAGTYIRTLAEDLAKKLGTCATLTQLRRTACETFSIRDASLLTELPLFPHISLQNIFKAFSFFEITNEQAQKLRFGQQDVLRVLNEEIQRRGLQKSPHLFLIQTLKSVPEIVAILKYENSWQLDRVIPAFPEENSSELHSLQPNTNDV